MGAYLKYLDPFSQPAKPPPEPSPTPAQKIPTQAASVTQAAPNVFLGEYHDEQHDRNIEKDFLKQYQEKYGKNGHHLTLTIELPDYYKAPAEEYFNSARTEKDSQKFWKKIVDAEKKIEPAYESPQQYVDVDNSWHGKNENKNSLETSSLFGGKKPDNEKLQSAEQRAGLIDIAFLAHDLGYDVEFVDEPMKAKKAQTSEGMTERNTFMAGQLAKFSKENNGGVVHIGGTFHGTTEGAGKIPAGSNTVQSEMAKQGVDCTVVNVSTHDVPPVKKVDNAQQIFGIIEAERSKAQAALYQGLKKAKDVMALLNPSQVQDRLVAGV